jgi:hypothetical protein
MAVRPAERAGFARAGACEGNSVSFRLTIEQSAGFDSVGAEPLAELISGTGQPAIAFGFGCTRVFDKWQLRECVSTDQTGGRDADETRGRAPRPAQADQQLARKLEQRTIGFNRLINRTRGLPGAEIVIAQLHRDGARAEFVPAEIRSQADREGEKLCFQCLIVIDINGERFFSRHRPGGAVRCDFTAIDPVAAAVQPAPAGSAEPPLESGGSRRQCILDSDHPVPRQLIGEDRSDAGYVSEPEFAHERYLLARLDDTHAGGLGTTGRELRDDP